MERGEKNGRVRKGCEAGGEGERERWRKGEEEERDEGGGWEKERKSGRG